MTGRDDVFAVVDYGSVSRVIRRVSETHWQDICCAPLEWATLIVEALSRPDTGPIVEEAQALRAANLSLAETLVERDRELSACRGATNV